MLSTQRVIKFHPKKIVKRIPSTNNKNNNNYKRVILRSYCKPTEAQKERQQNNANNNNLKALEEMPGVGDVHEFLRLHQEYAGRNHELAEKLFEQYGPIHRVVLPSPHGIMTTVNVLDPAEGKRILLTDQSNAFRGVVDPWMKYRIKRGLPPSVTYVKGDEWYHLRNPLNALLIPKNIDTWIPRIDRAADKLIDEIMAKPIMSAMEALHLNALYGLEVILSIVLGIDVGVLGSKPDPHLQQLGRGLAHATREMFTETEKLLFGITQDPTEHDKHWDDIFRIAGGFFKEYRSQIDKNDAFANMLLALDATKYSEEQKISLIVEVITGGVDTTTNLTTYTWSNLAQHDWTQDKILEEVKTISPFSTGKLPTITPDQVKQFKFLQSCISESIRLNPIVPSNSRILSHDVEIGGYSVPKGTMISPAVWASSRHPDYIPHPLKFEPEQTYDKFASKTFGAGSRQCPGERISRRELEISIAKILSKFKLKSAGPLGVLSGMLLKPIDYTNNPNFFEFKLR